MFKKSKGIIQFSLLAKWNLLVTRWPTFVEAMLAKEDIVYRLKEAYAIQEDLRQKRQSQDQYADLKQRKKSSHGWMNVSTTPM
jgi:hypothetical protein